MQFAAHGIGGLPGERRDLFVTELLVGYQQEQQAVFFGQRIERLLNALAEFPGFQHAQRRIGRGGGMFPDRFVGVADHVAVVPGLLKIATVIDRDPINPCPPRGIAAELTHLAESFQKNIVRGVLGFLRVPKKTQGKVIDGAAVLVVESGKFGRRQPGRRLDRALTFCQRLAP
jgi:hypothetical protein